MFNPYETYINPQIYDQKKRDKIIELGDIREKYDYHRLFSEMEKWIKVDNNNDYNFAKEVEWTVADVLEGEKSKAKSGKGDITICGRINEVKLSNLNHYADPQGKRKFYYDITGFDPTKEFDYLMTFFLDILNKNSLEISLIPKSIVKHWNCNSGHISFPFPDINSKRKQRLGVKSVIRELFSCPELTDYFLGLRKENPYEKLVNLIETDLEKFYNRKIRKPI